MPEAQLDRFMLQICIDYPDANAERNIVTMTADADLAPLPSSANAQDLSHYQTLIRNIPVPEPVVDTVVSLLHGTRPEHQNSPASTKESVQLGAGPRAGQLLVRAAQARAALSGHAAVRVQDVAALATPILAHRILLRYSAQAQNVQAANIVENILEKLGLAQ